MAWRVFSGGYWKRKWQNSRANAWWQRRNARKAKKPVKITPMSEKDAAAMEFIFTGRYPHSGSPIGGATPTGKAAETTEKKEGSTVTQTGEGRKEAWATRESALREHEKTIERSLAVVDRIAELRQAGVMSDKDMEELLAARRELTRVRIELSRLPSPTKVESNLITLLGKQSQRINTILGIK